MSKTVTTSAIAAITVGAASSFGANAALAADPLANYEPKYYLSLEGGAIFADAGTDKLGSFSGGSGSAITSRDGFDTDIGYRGAAAFGQQVNENWDWRVGVSYSNFLKNRSSVSYSNSGGSGSGSGFLQESKDLSYLTGDLELGYNLKPSGNTDLRLFAGLRALNSNSSDDKSGVFSSGGPSPISSAMFSVDSEFLGIGPRAGLDFSTRMGDSMLGFSGMAAGSILFGKLDQSTKISLAGSGGPPPLALEFGDSSSATVYNLEAALGVDLHITDSSVLTVGYRAEYWDSIRAEDKTGSGGSDNQTTLAHGPFVRFISRF